MSTRTGVPLVLVATEDSLTDGEIRRLPEHLRWHDKAVAIYLGDLEITRIIGEDLVWNRDGWIIIDETVAQWLRARLGGTP